MLRSVSPGPPHRDGAQASGCRSSLVRTGCRLNEGSPSPCIVGGSDLGNTLYSMGLMFWFGMITLPLGALGLLLSLAWLVGRVVSRR
jgi:hypothetical protein